MKLIVGTRSPGKTREIRELFAGLPFDVAFPADRLLQPLPEEADLERSTSYVENAVSKARYYGTRSGMPAVAETCDGVILREPRGTAGFGYDPLFYSEELHMTFGEAPPAAKHRVSHRGRAFRALIEVLLRRMSNVQ